ncbi:MAG: hypothetical protein UV59_C0033G0002 [Candidatus Gottesmanbacteria bacterium GW2011_GWA1_43_11]|uniref:Nucleotidyl transferase AbiEii/AbiGii toxin family protein n=1 Tax=Candidatus Gottesmanbacteria bacterium GW2011_GWA1_43_11 TaxID=1618436 RepID=A0A0G1CEA1_9BACT|nr:MAG: hypothetical protein UV59_C0033G0002 [Candidatus Gottesmanbacteria bacterium GW2011_GWA1_43_11]
MTKLYLDILDEPRKNVFEALQKLPKSLPLGGGTGLALQLGHRFSYDFDLFSTEPITRNWYRKLTEIFGYQPVKRTDSTDQLTVELKHGIQITILYYWYKPLYPLVSTSSLSLFDMRDIATDKAYTLGRRNVWRDYVDFYFLLQQPNMNLLTIIEDAQKRFGNEFSPKLFLEQLAYTNDIVDTAITFVTETHSKEKVTGFLQKEVRETAQKLISTT